MRSIRFASVVLFAMAARGEDYCFGFLNLHPERQEMPQDQAMEIQKAHLAHMNKLAMAGHLLAAGPMATPGGPRGIVIYRCNSVEQATQWTSADPAVQAKRLAIEMYRWRGPAGIGEPLMTKLKADPNTKYEMTRLPLVVFRKTSKWTGDAPANAVNEHVQVVRSLRGEKKLRAAGPFIDENDRVGTVPGVVGVYVFAEMPIEEAKAIVEHDPMVRDGYARVDVYLWMVAADVIPK